MIMYKADPETDEVTLHANELTKLIMKADGLQEQVDLLTNAIESIGGYVEDGACSLPAVGRYIKVHDYEHSVPSGALIVDLHKNAVIARVSYGRGNEMVANLNQAYALLGEAEDNLLESFEEDPFV